MEATFRSAGSGTFKHTNVIWPKLTDENDRLGLKKSDESSPTFQGVQLL